MSSFFSSLGKMIIFAAVLPGAVGFVVLAILFQPQYSSEKLTLEFVLMHIIGLGFLANTVGHFFDEWIHRKTRDDEGFIRTVRVLREKREISEIELHVLSKIEYLESLRSWYWNSATILVILLMYKLIHSLWAKYNTVSLVFILSILIVLFLFILSRWISINTKNILDKYSDSNGK